MRSMAASSRVESTTVAAGNQFPAEQDPCHAARPSRITARRWQATAVAAALVVVSACGPAANRSSRSPEKAPAMSRASLESGAAISGCPTRNHA